MYMFAYVIISVLADYKPIGINYDTGEHFIAKKLSSIRYWQDKEKAQQKADELNGGERLYLVRRVQLTIDPIQI